MSHSWHGIVFGLGPGNNFQFSNCVGEREREGDPRGIDEGRRRR